MSRTIFIPREIEASETRVAASPDTVKRLVGLGLDVIVETGAGLASRITDEEFAGAGAAIGSAGDASKADVVLKVRRPGEAELKGYKSGAAVIAITASKSPLAKKATVCIPVDHTEDSSTFIAMISRILHLLVIDMVSVGVAVRRSPTSPMSQLGAGLEPEGAATPAPGVLISHVA